MGGGESLNSGNSSVFMSMFRHGNAATRIDEIDGNLYLSMATGSDVDEWLYHNDDSSKLGRKRRNHGYDLLKCLRMSLNYAMCNGFNVIKFSAHNNHLHDCYIRILKKSKYKFSEAETGGRRLVSIFL